MKIFIINLKRSSSRRSRMERNMRKVNLDYEFFEAIDGFKLTEEEYFKNIDATHQYPRQFNKGELGCLLSHYAVLKRIVDNKIPYALILEDDIEISIRLPEVLKLVEKQIVQGEVISLYASFPEPCRLFTEKIIDQNYYFIKPYEGELVVGAVAYIVTFKAAQNMVKSLLPMDNVVDDWRHWLQSKLIVDFKIVFPHPIDLNDNYSDINESSGGVGLNVKKIIVNYELPILSNLILKKRKKERWEGRKSNIIINGSKPEMLYY